MALTSIAGSNVRRERGGNVVCVAKTTITHASVLCVITQTLLSSTADPQKGVGSHNNPTHWYLFPSLRLQPLLLSFQDLGMATLVDN